jgi:hypothetical protein
LEQETASTEIPEWKPEYEADWAKVREVSAKTGLSVQRIYQIAYSPASPLETKLFKTGRSRTELKISRTSFAALMKDRGIQFPDIRGRQLAEALPF